MDNLILKTEDALSEQTTDLQNIQLDSDNVILGDIDSDVTISTIMAQDSSTEMILPVSQNVQQPIFQACRVVGNASNIRQVAIAPKPVTLVANTIMNPVKKISLSNLRPKTPLIDPSRRQLVVVPATDGRIKVVGAGTTSLAGKSTTTQLVTAGGNQILQLRQGGVPPLTKYTIVQSTDASVNSATKLSPRFLSLQQAQQMGIVSSGKIQQIVVSPVKQGTGTSTPIIKPLRQTITTLKSPTKILPAPPKGTINAGKVLLTSVPQNIVIKPTITNTAQMVKVEGNTGNTIVASVLPGQKFNPQQIHQINLPGKGMQYVRLVPSGSNQKTSTTQVRLAPMSTATTVQTLASSSNMTIQTKPPQLVSKPLMLDLQGGIIQIAGNNQNIASKGNSTISLKKVIGKNPTKFVPVTFNVTPTVKKIQTSSAGSYSVLNMASIKKSADLLNSSNDNKEMQISKTEIMDDVMEEIVQDSMMEDDQLTGVLPSVSSNTSFQPDMKHIVMVPASYLQQIQGQNANTKPLTIAANVEIKQEMEKNTVDCSLDFGMRPRKPCNCTKSQCLKLYCDCFANGEFCNQCNCNNCYNNLENEDFRQKAIRTCLERNPNAFRPKIGKAKNYGLEGIRRHNKGCNCKRSGCLKNYCECYEGKIACSANCKCIGCRNIEDCFDKQSMRKGRPDSLLKSYCRKIDDLDQSRDSMGDMIKSDHSLKRDASNRIKRPWNYMTSDVIEAVCSCLLAQAADAEACEGPDTPSAAQLIIEEFGRCLNDMINTTQIQPPSTIPDDARGLSS